MKRKDVFEKYSRKCAYCGTGLGFRWQVDHIEPKVNGGTDDFSNLNPACASCNNYKSGNSVELFRSQLKTMLNEKNHYLFKSNSKMKIAIQMGVIEMKKWNGIFYFEKSFPS
jgi:hypothetical protein